MTPSLPTFIAPMLAIPGSTFASPDHLYEPKWDGIRCLAFCDEQLRLMTRAGNNVTKRFPELSQLAENVEGRGWILDGELVVLDESGKPSFDQVRDRNLVGDQHATTLSGTIRPAVLVLFDILYHGGRSLLERPLSERRDQLHEVVHPNSRVALSLGVQGAGAYFHEIMLDKGLEGSVIKRLDSPYLPGRRSRHWVKVRRQSQADCVIGGFSVSSGRSHPLRSLLMGQILPNGHLLYIGQVGTGFTSTQCAALLSALQTIVTERSPFVGVPADAAVGAYWTKAALVCRVDYLTWTRRGLLRHPVFRGLRTDKSPDACLLEPDHPFWAAQRR